MSSAGVPLATPVLISYVALWIFVAFQSCVLIGLLRVVYRLREETGAAGEAAPAFTARDLDGMPVSQTDFLGSRTILLFVSTLCSTCRSALENISSLKAKVDGRVLVVCAGPSRIAGSSPRLTSWTYVSSSTATLRLRASTASTRSPQRF